MNIFIVTERGQPAHVTYCEEEASRHFDQAVEESDTGTIVLIAVATSVANTSILRHEKYGA